MRLAGVLLVWLVAAVLVGVSGLLERVPLLAIQGILLSLTVLALVSYFAFSSVRASVERWAPQGVLVLHLSRFVGVYFLYLESVGRLPWAFAVPAGWGDIIVAACALVILFAPALRRSRRVLLVWNTLGLIDILFVVATAARLNLTRPGELDELTRLPLSLLPTIIVPLVIATHIVLFHQLLKRRESAGVS
jgi:hypothetical protein